MQTTVSVPRSFQWLVSKSKPMIDSAGAAIPNSGMFRGNVPGRMRQELRAFCDAASTQVRGTNDSTVYNVTVDGVNYALTFGARMSTQNTVKLTFCPDVW